MGKRDRAGETERLGITDGSVAMRCVNPIHQGVKADFSRDSGSVQHRCQLMGTVFINLAPTVRGVICELSATPRTVAFLLSPACMTATPVDHRPLGTSAGRFQASTH